MSNHKPRKRNGKRKRSEKYSTLLTNRKKFKNRKVQGSPIIEGLGVYFGTGCDC